MKLALAFVLAGCGESYLRVVVEGTDPELTVAPAEVRVGVYAGDERLDFDYIASLEPEQQGGVPGTDFVLLTDEMSGAAQLRVSIPTTTTTWFTDARVAGEGELRLPLFAGERSIATANFSGDAETSVLFGAGIAMAWVDSGGVQVRIERDPDRLIARSDVVVPDRDATAVRLASRLNPLGYGPDLYALGWIAGDGSPFVRITSQSAGSTAPVLVQDTADDLVVAAAQKGELFAVAVATRDGDVVRLHALTEAGAPIGPAAPTISTAVTALVGVALPRDRVIIGLRENNGSRLMAFGVTSAVVLEPQLDILPVGDLIAMSLSADGSRLFTLERRGTTVFQVSYFSDLTPTGTVVELGSTVVGGRAALSGCTAAWPEVRADGSNVTDLRFAVLGPDGELLGEPHLLNVGETGDHVSPTLVCASPTRGYATFFERAGTGDPLARLLIRRIPTY